MSNEAEIQKFQRLFEAPDRTELAQMPQKQFSAFVGYVFRRAGYETSGRVFKLSAQADFELARAGQAAIPCAAVIAKQMGEDEAVESSAITKMRKSALVRKRGQSGFIVTSGVFDKAAYDASHDQNIFLLDGNALCRYIHYVNGSRYDESTGITVCIPPDLFARPITPPEHQAKILAIANNKGGVGKTTTARYFALHLANRGKRVLLVDMDGQGNLSEGYLGVQMYALRTGDLSMAHLGHYFAGQLPLRKTVRQANGANISLIPAHSNLSLLDTGGAGRPDIEMRFAHDLAELANLSASGSVSAFDWIILDTPPAISLFTRAALCAADYVVAPARSRPSSLAGLRNMLATLDTMNALRQQPAQLLGCVITHWDDDEMARNTYVRLEEQFDRRHSRIFEKEIPFDSTVDKTQGIQTRRAENAYEAVVEEVLRYV